MRAEVGDDVYREDPTVNRLEEMSAALFGKEAGLFVPSGVMGNTIGLKVHTEHGQEVICEARSHIMNYELSMMAWFTGCLGRTIPTEAGILSWEAIEAEIRPLGPHSAPTGLIEIENTHNLGGGHCYPLAEIDKIGEGAHARGIPVHMDGARVLHASVATGVPVDRIVRNVDTVMFCLSKALGAPVGSMLVGPRKLIDKGRLYRKRLGGGMRQAGILAGAGIYALENHIQGLATDHENANVVREGLLQLPGMSLQGKASGTNIVMLDTSGTGWEATVWVAKAKAQGVILTDMGKHLLRAVTHYDVSRGKCVEAVERMKDVWKTQ